MFQKKPSSAKGNTDGNGEFINFALWLKRTKKVKDKTIELKLKHLKIILKCGKNPLDTEAIEDYKKMSKNEQVRCILVAPQIPDRLRSTLEQNQMEYKEIPFE